MAKTLYVGINNLARKVKKMYVGIDGKARKVKKAYIGVGGKARLFWVSEFTITIIQSSNQTITVKCNGTSYTSSFIAPAGSTYIVSIVASSGYNAGTLSVSSGILTNNITISATAATVKTLSYAGTATGLTQARSSLVGASVKNFALFAGGSDKAQRYTTVTYSTVDAYNTSLTRSTPTALSSSRRHLAGASVGNYALFAGGLSGDSVYSKVDAYNTSLTKTIPTTLKIARYSLAATTVGNYALFSGGYNNNSFLTTVDANTSLTRSTPTALSQAKAYHSGASVGNYALFAGGGVYSSGTAYSTVDAYNASLTKSIATALSKATSCMGSASVGDYALFAGGGNHASNTTNYTTVYKYAIV